MLLAIVPPCREVSGSHNSQAEAFEEIPGSHRPCFQNSKESTFRELYWGKKSGQSLPFVVLDAQGIFRQQPKRDRKPEVARQLEKYVHLIPSWGHLLDIWIGCSTQIIWSPFLWGFQIKKLRFKTACSLRPDCSNELCLVSHMGLNSLCPLLREEASIHVEVEGFQLTASVQVNQDLLATQDRKAKARISAHTDQ